MATIGPWTSYTRHKRVGNGEYEDVTVWKNSETGEVRDAIPEPGREEQFMGRNESGTGPGIWNSFTGRFENANPYTTEQAQLEKMMQTSGPLAGHYMYIGPDGTMTYNLAEFNRLTGNNYTDSQIPDLGHNLDSVRGNDTSGFDRAYQNIGDLGIEAVRGILGYQSGGTSELLFGLTGPNDNARDARAARTGAIGGLASSIFGGPKSSGGSIADASNVEGTGTTLNSSGQISGSTTSQPLQYASAQGPVDAPIQEAPMDSPTSFDGSGVDQFGNPTGEFTNTGQLSSAGSGDFYDPSIPSGSSTDWTSLIKQYGGSLWSALNSPTGQRLLGAGGGAALASLLGGSKPAGTTTTVQDIPDWQKQLLMPALMQSYGLLQQQQGQTSPLLGQAQDTLGKTISGGFLNSNPYLDATYNQAAKSVTDNYNSVVRPQNDAMFYKAGAFGPSNSAYDETVARNQFGLGQNLQNLATNIYGGNFAQERQNQLNASANAPAFSQASLSTQFQPFKDFLSVAGGNFGGNVQQPYFQNNAGNIFGGALLGSQLFK